MLREQLGLQAATLGALAQHNLRYRIVARMERDDVPQQLMERNRA